MYVKSNQRYDCRGYISKQDRIEYRAYETRTILQPLAVNIIRRMSLTYSKFFILRNRENLIGGLTKRDKDEKFFP